MKITRKQLRRIISEEMAASSNEGVMDVLGGAAEKAKAWWKEKQSLSPQDQLRAAQEQLGGEIKSEDAWSLFKAMYGVGTDEAAIQSVMQKRAGDLVNLYNEWQQLVKVLTAQDTMDDIASIFGLEARSWSNWNSDLITWLDADGMDDEAQQLEDLLDAEGVQRSIPNPDFKVFGGLMKHGINY